MTKEIKLKHRSWFAGFVLLSVLSLLPGLGHGTGQTGASFLTVPIGAKPNSMAGAFTGVADSVDTIYYNTAGLATLAKNEINFMHTQLSPDVSQEYFAMAQSLGGMGTVGLSVNYLWMTGLLVTTASDPDGNSGTIFSANDLAVDLAYGSSFTSEWFWGAGAKYISRQLGDSKAQGEAVDLGTLFVPQGLPDLKIGAAIQNLGLPMTFISLAENMPVTYRVGISDRILHNDVYNFMISADGVQPSDGFFYEALGAEYWLKDTLGARFGYRFKQETPAFTYGIGVRVHDKPFSFGFDFSESIEADSNIPDMERLSVYFLY